MIVAHRVREICRELAENAFGICAASDVALRSRQLRPIEPEFFADLAYHVRIKVLARSDLGQLCGSPSAVDRHAGLAVSSVFTVMVETTPALGQPIPKGRTFH
jgi:hypothetical protein